ncbi:MAG: hypothetical protein HKN03_09750 [Acidimicrobiales bacterium]|nr:hypothetical protein [Acidimicrobiales bacterium]
MNEAHVSADQAEETPEVDELPDDLNATRQDLEDYIFPNNNRRRIPGYLYLASAVVLIGLYVGFGGDGVLVNRGYLWAAGIAGIFGVYSLLSGWNLAIDERDALVVAAIEVGQPIGPASAQLSWRGLLSRPVWRILCYTAEDPPLTRALVIVDGVDGSVVERIVEDNPEDWDEVTAAP